MRTRSIGMMALGLLLAAVPFASACYAPRVQSCRNPIADFSGISNVTVVDPVRDFAFEAATPSVEFTLRATTTMGNADTCVAVRSELRDPIGNVIEVLDTPIRASIRGGTLTTTSIFHYHASTSLAPMTVHVTALGTTLDATVTDPRFADAGAPRTDGGIRDTGSRPLDGGP